MTGDIAEGWLSKNTLLSLSSSRHKRYCILTNNELRYYKHKDDLRPAGIIDLKHFHSAERQHSKQHPYSFRIITHCKSHRTHSFSADNEQDCQYWIDMINLKLKYFKGLCHDHCEELNSLSSSSSSTIINDDYSVLDKYLDLLNLNDRTSNNSNNNSNSNNNNNNIWIPSSSSSTISASSTITTAAQQIHIHQQHISSLSSSLSPKLKPYRSSTESLDSLPSEVSLSSSASSRAQSILGHPPPPHSSSTTSGHLNILSKTKSSSSNLISKSLSTIKKHQQQIIRHEPICSIKNDDNKLKKDQHSRIDQVSTTVDPFDNNNNNWDKAFIDPHHQHKEWVNDELFDFEDDTIIDHSNKLNKSLPPPITALPLPSIPNLYMKK
ncbi:hypothetical protein BJ944DRAFT_21402 [Cunninghamella echinulata]|nr:hypothetical protein BJ944DRAFT_21402 [Cunninghamella echinulata]